MTDRLCYPFSFLQDKTENNDHPHRCMPCTWRTCLFTRNLQEHTLILDLFEQLWYILDSTSEGKQEGMRAVWHYHDKQRFRQPFPAHQALAQSTYDLLLGLRNAAVTLLFLDLSDPQRPVNEVPGFVEEVATAHLTLGLAAPLPSLPPNMRFGVEVMAGPGILRFQSMAYQQPELGTTRLLILLPRQIESVQRRKFTRTPFSGPIAYSPALEQLSQATTPSGIGHAVDLGPGGIRFLTHTPVNHGQTLYLSFNTPDGATYRGLPGKVVRIQQAEERISVAVRFSAVDAALEEQLVQSIFRLQLRGLSR